MGHPVASSRFHLDSKLASAARCFSIVACDQSRMPPGRSIRGTSSPVNGRYWARQLQNSFESFWRASGPAFSLGDCPYASLQPTRKIRESITLFVMSRRRLRVCSLRKSKIASQSSVAHRRFLLCVAGIFIPLRCASELALVFQSGFSFFFQF